MRTAYFIYPALLLFCLSCQKQQATSALPAAATSNNTPPPPNNSNPKHDPPVIFTKYYGTSHSIYLDPPTRDITYADSIFISFPTKDSILISPSPFFDSNKHLITHSFEYKINAAGFYGDSASSYNHLFYTINGNTISMEHKYPLDCDGDRASVQFNGTQK